MDIEIEQVRWGVHVAVSLDAADVFEQVPDGVRVADGRSEVVLRVEDGAGFHAVRTVAEFAEAIERERSEQRRKALRDLDAAHKRVKAQLRDERARAAELERKLERERARSEELRERQADELERALNMALTGAWHAAKCALRDAGWTARPTPDACDDEARSCG